jgi:L-malate glycosyltransferase
MSCRRQTRVAYVNHTGSVSGAEHVLINMVRGLDRTAYDPFVICPEGGDLATLLKAEGVACLALPAVHARFSWRPSLIVKAATSLIRAVVALRRTLTCIEPDIVHANTLRAGIVASVASIGTSRPVVWHVHDNLPRHPFSMLIRFAAIVLRPRRVIAVSDSTAKAFRGPFSFNGRISTIQNGTDLSRFPPKSADSFRRRTFLRIPEDAFVICAIGQICARKGLLELVEAFAIAHAQAPQMHLVIVGAVVFEHEKSYYDLVQRAAAIPEISGNVRFTGQIQNVSALLQTSDLLVLNSHEEPFGLVLIEAMSSGTPVLATRVGGIPEIVKDSVNGWLVEKGATTSLAAKLLDLSRDRPALEKVAQIARDETCPQFSLERFQSQLQRFYVDLISNQKRMMGQAHSVRPCN